MTVKEDQLLAMLLRAHEALAAVRAAMRPVALLERQAGDFVDLGQSLLRAYATGAGAADRHAGAAQPFMQDAQGAGVLGGERERVAVLLLGAEMRRGLLTYRVAGLTPRVPESRLAQALKEHADPASRHGLEALRAELSRRRRQPVAESDVYLAAWGEGLSVLAGDPEQGTDAVRQDDAGFIRVVLACGHRAGERARSAR